MPDRTCGNCRFHGPLKPVEPYFKFSGECLFPLPMHIERWSAPTYADATNCPTWAEKENEDAQ